jgi:hypothetical protein
VCDTTGDGTTVVDFIAFFALDRQKRTAAENNVLYIVESVPKFVPSETAQGAPYRMVRVSFAKTIHFHMNDKDEFPEADFDWSAMPVDKSLATSLNELRALWEEYRRKTGLSPIPSMYEVEFSPLLAKLAVDSGEYKHVILVGEDQFFDVVARSWTWAPGQAVD